MQPLSLHCHVFSEMVCPERITTTTTRYRMDTRASRDVKRYMFRYRMTDRGMSKTVAVHRMMARSTSSWSSELQCAISGTSMSAITTWYEHRAPKQATTRARSVNMIPFGPKAISATSRNPTPGPPARFVHSTRNDIDRRDSKSTKPRKKRPRKSPDIYPEKRKKKMKKKKKKRKKKKREKNIRQMQMEVTARQRQ